MVEVSTVAQSNVQQSQPSKSRKAVGNLTGAAIGLSGVGYLLYDALHLVPEQEASELAIGMKNFMPEIDSFENVKATAEKVLESTGLKDKGVKLNFIDGSEESLNNLREIISKNCSSKSWIDRRVSKNMYTIFKEGANAAFLPKSNDIVVSAKNIYGSVIHETGHALNKNGNLLTKTLCQSRLLLTPLGISVVAPIALGIGLFHKVDKTKPNSEKSKKEKTLDFISNNAGKLTLASYLPMLTEEGLASCRGLKAYKPKLSEGQLLHYAKNFTKAWSSYAIAAALVSGSVALGIWAANKIKNSGKNPQASAETVQPAATPVVQPPVQTMPVVPAQAVPVQTVPMQQSTVTSGVQTNPVYAPTVLPQAKKPN